MNVINNLNMYIKLFKRDHFGHGFSNSPFQDAALGNIIVIEAP